MHGSCKSVSDGERYIIIMLVVLRMFRGEAVAHVRKNPTCPCIRGSHDDAHKSLLVFHYLD